MPPWPGWPPPCWCSAPEACSPAASGTTSDDRRRMSSMPPGRPLTSSISGSDDVRVARDGGVISIVLDRPADQNRITRDVLLTLHGLTEQLASDEAAQVVVLTGAGPDDFSVGSLNTALRASDTNAQ